MRIEISIVKIMFLLLICLINASCQSKKDDYELDQALKLAGDNRVELEKKRAELKRFTDFRDGMFVYRDPKKNEEIWMFDVIESEHYQFVWEL